MLNPLPNKPDNLTPDHRAASDHDVCVSLGDRSYSIHIGKGLRDSADVRFEAFVKDRHIVVFSDTHVAPIYLERLISTLKPVALGVDSVVVEAGERSKSIDVCDRIWQQMLSFPADRSSVVIALGGGVVGDLGGFIASTYGRGVDFIQIPTSLLAQVDSSVGGKVGVNLPHAKNMVGAFWQPKTVLIDTDVLSTLDHRNFSAGLAEVVKYGLIMDEPLFAFLEQSIEPILNHDSDVLAKMIAWCCRCKAQVVEEDETERSGRRAILNYGHTFGHAIESVFGYGTFLHGEAIAIGMTCAGRLARQMGMVDQSFLDRQTNLFNQFKLPVDCPNERHDELVAAMKHDKKVSQGKLNLILPTEIGNVQSVPAPADSEILASLKND